MFYNPAQVINRDLSLAVLRVFGRRRAAEYARGEKHTRNRLRELKQKAKEQRKAKGPAAGGEKKCGKKCKRREIGAGRRCHEYARAFATQASQQNRAAARTRLIS